MVVAVTGYAFDGAVENGGHGLKLGMWRVQAARVAKRRQREATREPDTGKLRYNGDVVREKGDCYLIDTTVTGSDEGTSESPKFSLKALFEQHLFVEISKLVGLEGQYEGYIPVIQGDNAGPHQDETFLNFCKDFCQDHGWHWQPQAPQMPHMNNLDLAVLPAMSHRHTHMLRASTGASVKPDRIWEAACSVWKALPSAIIARGFALAYRVADQVIKHKGSNKFLHDAKFHARVRGDFYETDTGIGRKHIIVE
jgi:hypothetical protein